MILRVCATLDLDVCRDSFKGSQEWTVALVLRVRADSIHMCVMTDFRALEANSCEGLSGVWELRAPEFNSCEGSTSHMKTLLDIQVVIHVNVHPKTLFEIPVALPPNSSSFPSNSNVSAAFSISINSGKFWNVGISNKLWDIQCWREGRILINLCGKNNVRNCDLSQRDFFCEM